MLGTGITTENRAEVAEKIGKHIRTYAGNNNEFFKEIEASSITSEEEINRVAGKAFIDSGYLEVGTTPTQETKANQNIAYAEGNLSGRMIALEAGHGAPLPCSQGADGVNEGEMNQVVVMKLKSKLEADGATVVLTRVTDCSDNSRDKCSEINSSQSCKSENNLRKRAEIANNANADIVLDIHHDHIEIDNLPAVRGTRIYGGPCDPNFITSDSHRGGGCNYDEVGSANSRTLGRIILDKLSAIYGTYGSGLGVGNYNFLRYCTQPAVIIEITGSDDPDINHESSAQALYEAVHEYFETNPTQYLEPEKELGVNIGLILAIAKVEVEYTKPETTWKCSDCAGAKNAFNAQDEDSELLEYSSWLEGVRAQGKYIYYTYGENGQNTVTDIAEARGEGESWASAVRREMTNLFVEIPELSLGGVYGSGDIVQKALEYLCANRRDTDPVECSFDVKGGWGLNNAPPRKIPYWKGGETDRSSSIHCGPDDTVGTEVLMSNGNGVDCSGLVSRVLREALPDKFSPNYCMGTCWMANNAHKESSSYIQVANSSTWNDFVSSNQLIPGDLLLKAWEHNGCGDCQPCGHIMIYVGKDSDNKHIYIHSSRTAGGVYDGPQMGKSSSLNFSHKWGIYRVK